MSTELDDFMTKVEQFVNETSDGRRCSACHAECEPLDPDWRFNGEIWEHACPNRAHPQCGYFPSEPDPDAPRL